jgi:Zn finger protein HypA/HybF involved in hydrogenase expression
MQTKFIEGTNEQYSIREDGVVIKHFKKQRISNTLTIKVQTNNIVKLTKTNCINIHFNGKPKSFTPNKLLKMYFNYCFCQQCNNKFIPDISPVKCNNCRKENKRVSANNYSYKSAKELTPTYIASALKISINELTSELYEHHKSLIELKRKIAKENNITIYKLK